MDMSEPPNDPDKEDYLVHVIISDLYAAKNPIVLVDAYAIRHRCLEEASHLLKKTEPPSPCRADGQECCE